MSAPRLVAALLAAAVLASGLLGPALLAVPDRPPVTPAVEALELEGDSPSGFATQDVDVSTALAMDRARLEARLERAATGAAFDRAGTEQERREVLFEAATTVEIAISSLRADQREARRAYATGRIDEEAFLQAHAVHAVRARALERNLDEIQSRADRIPDFSMQSRIESLRASLAGFGGPVTQRAREAATGERGPARLFVSATANGTVLASIDEGVYHREAHRADNWVPDSIRNLDLETVETRAFERYPTAMNSSQTRSRAIGTVAADIYRIEAGYEQGSVFAYLDGDTEEVFYETQRQPLDRIRPGPAVTNRAHGVTLAANRTRPGGPLRLATSNETGAPVAATVVVADATVQTGPDGVAWTLMPGSTTEVVAVTPRGNVTLRVRPT